MAIIHPNIIRGEGEKREKKKKAIYLAVLPEDTNEHQYYIDLVENKYQLNKVYRHL